MTRRTFRHSRRSRSATGDLLEVQDVSATPDVHGKATIDDVTTYVGANVSITDSQVPATSNDRDR